MSVLQMIAALSARLRAIVRRGTVDREMRDEMALHLEQATERLMRRGLSEVEARNADVSRGLSQWLSPIVVRR